MGIVSKVLIFAAGAVVGGVASGLFFKKKYEKKADEEISQMRAYYGADGEKPEEKEESDTDESIDISSYESKHTEVPASDKEITNFKRPGEPVDYTSYYAGAEHPEDDEGDMGSHMTKSHQENAGKPPKVIKTSEFGDDPYFETATLLYYVENDVLTTEGDEIIGAKDLDEIKGMVGDALTKYGFKDNGDPRIYVRNYARNTDYEIVKVFGAFEG